MVARYNHVRFREVVQSVETPPPGGDRILLDVQGAVLALVVRQ